jgi:ApaG protein
VAAAVAQPRRHAGLPPFAAIVHDGAMSSSEATTLGVKVAVECEYDSERSRPLQHQWFFRYTITITNNKAEAVQLLSRHWIITDGTGEVDEVRGLGVVGQQPAIEPGESYTYSSGASIATSSGRMEGTFQMAAQSGQLFDVKIGRFALEQTTVH